MWTHGTSRKLLHPTIKLLQCAESKEESGLNSYSCVQSAVFLMKLEQLEEAIMEMCM